MNIIARIQRWMDSVPGQTFMNYAYSWGAAVVILGTLFKLTHIPGANFMLFLGMGTEVFVFFIAGFDRPFQSNTELTEDYVDEDENEKDVDVNANVDRNANANANQGGGTVIIGGGVPANGPVIIGGGVQGGAPIEGGAVQTAAVQGGISASDAAALAAASLAAANTQAALQNTEGMLASAQAANAPEVEDAIEAYVDQLQQLTEVLVRVREQATKMTHDSEEMINLNRTLTGINTIYEMQLKSISQQVGTIDQINEQTRRMAAQIEELNGVYARMITALTVNMPNSNTQV